MAEIETVEVNASQEEASPNGHQWQTFDDDQALLRHILSKKPAEEIVEVPEWDLKILCRALSVPDRIAVEMACYDDQKKTTDYRKDFYKVIMAGCFNPATGKKIFTESNRAAMLRDSGPVVRLALAVLRLSSMLGSDQERTRKN